MVELEDKGWGESRKREVWGRLEALGSSTSEVGTGQGTLQVGTKKVLRAG